MDFSSKFTVIPLPFPNLSNSSDYQNESPVSCYLVKLPNSINILCDCPLDLKQAYSINIEMDSSALVPSHHNMITDWSYGPQTIDLNAYVTKPRDATYSLFPWIILPKWDLVDFGTLDYILVSNHHLITALPYITEYTNFKGQILATSPIKHFARWLLFDLIANIPKHPIDAEKLDELGIDYINNFNHVHTPFTTNDIEESLSKVTWVAFNQRVPMSSHDLEDYFEAFSSGFQIGASNWLINTANAKIGYISTSASKNFFQNEFVNCNIDKTLFQRCDQLLISNLHFSLPYFNSKKFDELSYDQNYNELEQVIDELSSKMANIIFPVEMDGTLFNLLNIVYEWGKKKNRLNKTKIFFISKNAQQWAQLTHKCFEWVNQKNQNQYLFHAISTSSAEIPPISTILIEFSEWILKNLHFYEDVTAEAIQILHTNPNFQYIAFCDHPSFKSGRCYQLVKCIALYSPPGRPHSVIFTDGRFDARYYKDARFNMGSLRSYFLPLDPTFDENLVSSLIDYLPNPPQILIEESNAKLMKDFSLKSSLSATIKYLSASIPNVITIDSSHTTALAEPSLLSSLSGKWLYHRQLMTSFQGLCNLENRNQIHLTTFKSLPKFNSNITRQSPPIWATISLSDLIEALNQMEYGSINKEKFSILPSSPTPGLTSIQNGASNHSNSEENGTINEYSMDDICNESYRLTFSGMSSSIHHRDPCILVECQKHTQLVQSIRSLSSNRQLSNEIFDYIQKVTINFNQQV